MPIHRDSHPNDADLKPGTTKSDIIVFLYRNLELAFTPSEIAEELDIPEGTATTTLRRLHNNGLIGRMADGHYHGLETREDLRRYPQSVEETKAMFVHHPDNPDAPAPDPAREPDVEGVTDANLDGEVEELEDELDG